MARTSSRLPRKVAQLVERAENLGKGMQLDPVAKKELLGDGNYGGLYQRSDEEMLAMWRVAVEETRALMQDGWA
jgi:creatinine amidohydrolase